MKSAHLPSSSFHLLLAWLLLLASPLAHATTYTWTNLDDGVGTPISTTWSSGTSWSAAPVSASTTTLVFGYSFGSNSTAETNNLTNDIANPFQLNVLTLGINTPGAANGSQIALINIAGSPLEFVSNGGTTPQVNLSQSRSNGQVVSFDVQSGVVLTNNTLFTGNGTANFTISGAISGGGNFTKGGSSRLVLSGTNSYGGTTTISGGMLQFTKQVSLYNNNTVAGGWTAANISVASGAILALSVGGTGEFTTANVTTILNNLGGANGSSSGGFAAGSTIGLVNAGTVGIADTITNTTGTGGGALAVTKFGAGVLTLSGANTYTGTTSILQGSLTLAPTAGGMNLGAITATTGGTLAYGIAATNITLTLGGAGTNTITSITETSNAAQQLIITKNTAATWSVGNVDLKQGNGSTVSLGILNLNGTLTFGLAAGTLRQFSVSGGTLNYNNAGAVKTIGTTTATVTTGTWLTFSGGTLDNFSGSDITTSTNNPNLRLEAGLTFTGTNSLNFGTGRVSLGSAAGTSRTITVSANTLTLGGIISSGTTATALTKAGNGTLALGGANSYNGITTISAGKLTILSAGTINSSSSVSIGAGEFNYNSATALSQGVSFSTTGGKLSGSGTITPSVTVTSGNTLAPGNSIGILTFGTNLTLSGNSDFELGNSTGAGTHGSPYNSDRSIVSGTLTLGGTLNLIDNAGADGNGSVAAGSYLIFTQTGTASGSFATINNVTGYHAVVNTATSGSVFLDNYQIASANSIATPVNLGTFHAGATATQALTVQNTASSVLSEGLNATMGATTADATVSGSNIINLAGGASDNTSILVGINTATAGSKTGTVAIGLASNGTNSGYSNTSLTGQTITVNASVYSGLMIWNGGTGTYGTGGNWTDSVVGGAQVAPGLDAGFTGVDTATFNGSGGAVNLDGSNPNLNAITFNNNGNYILAQGTGGTLTLSGTTPSITVSGTGTGTHEISAPLTLAANTTATVNSTSTLNLSGTISGSGQTLTKEGAGTLVVSSSSATIDTTTVNAGTLVVNGILTGDLTTGPGTVLRGGGSITGSTAISGTIAAGTGNIIDYLATGALTLDGTSTFAYKIDRPGTPAGDLLAVTGALNLNSNSLLTITDGGSGSWVNGDKLTLISYSGAWNGALFTYLGNPLLDGSTISVGGTNWLFDYNDLIGPGSNFNSYLTGPGYVTMTAVVPEPSRAMLMLLGAAGLMMRRRRKL